MIGIMPSLEMSMVTLVDAHTRASSSTMIAWVTWSAPAPPYGTGIPSAGSSISTDALKPSHGKAASRSTSAAWGAMRSSHIWRIALRNCLWVSSSANAGVGSIPQSRAPRCVRGAPGRRSLAMRSTPGARAASRFNATGAVSGIQWLTPLRTSKRYGPVTQSTVASAALASEGDVLIGPHIEGRDRDGADVGE